MAKKYINVRTSIRQHEVDNWLLMIPSNKVSSDAKIVYLVLKKIQGHDMACMTDSHSWFKVCGLSMERIKECLNELEAYGLIEQYYSALNANSKREINKTFTAYLLDHHIMKGCYNVVDCPHDGNSFGNPQDAENILRHSQVARTIKDFQETALGNKNENSHEANIAT